MELTFRAARQGLAEGLDDEALFHRIATTGSFGGTLRGNLVEMLDGIGLNRFLRVPSCAALFEDSSGLVHFTSAAATQR